MASDKDKWVELIAQLIQRTQDGRLKWTSFNPRHEAIETVYTARFQDKALRLYKQQKNDELPWAVIGGRRDRTVLEVVDESDTPLWTFPGTPALDDLIEAVRFQVAGIDKFFKDLLAD